MKIAKPRVIDEDRLLRLVQAHPRATLGSLAVKMGWRIFNGDPNKMKVGRAFKGMKKLVTQTRGGNYKLTDEGEAVLKGEKREAKTP